MGLCMITCVAWCGCARKTRMAAHATCISTPSGGHTTPGSWLVWLLERTPSARGARAQPPAFALLIHAIVNRHQTSNLCFLSYTPGMWSAAEVAETTCRLRKVMCSCAHVCLVYVQAGVAGDGANLKTRVWQAVNSPKSPQGNHDVMTCMDSIHSRTSNSSAQTATSAHVALAWYA